MLTQTLTGAKISFKGEFMKKQIYVPSTDKNIVFEIEFNEGNMRKLERNIDAYFGMGDIKEDIRTGFDLFYDSNLANQKIKILSKDFIKKEKEYTYGDSILQDVNLYKYKYYAFIPHPLSIICSNILEQNDPVILSDSIKDLIDYNISTEHEGIFVKDILSEIKFNEIVNMQDNKLGANNSIFSVKLKSLKINLLKKEK